MGWLRIITVMTKIIKDNDGDYIQHEALLQSLIDHCDVASCVFGCCGYNNCDFSPMRIASFIYDRISKAGSSGKDKSTLASLTKELTSSIERLEAEFGSQGVISNGYEHEDCSEYYPGETIDKLCSDLLHNINVAFEMLNLSQAKAAPKREYQTQGQIDHWSKKK